MSTVFKKIIDKEITADILFENDSILAFRDINPQAPVHFLVIPKKEISTINDLDKSNISLLGEMLLVAKNIAKSEGIDESGYRIVSNCNQDGQQTVFHIHLHVLGGRKLNWPPG